MDLLCWLAFREWHGWVVLERRRGGRYPSTSLCTCEEETGTTASKQFTVVCYWHHRFCALGYAATNAATIRIIGRWFEEWGGFDGMIDCLCLCEFACCEYTTVAYPPLNRCSEAAIFEKERRLPNGPSFLPNSRVLKSNYRKSSLVSVTLGDETKTTATASYPC